MAKNDFHFFYAGPLSQWSNSPFVWRGQRFSCAEQAMMWGKAMLFGDHAIAQKIMAESSPKQMQNLGRRVTPFDPKIWNAECVPMVAQISRAKYDQNPSHKRALMAYPGRIMVEASPIDRNWGIGLRESDPRAWNRATWLGDNKLGFVLTKLRDAYIAEESRGTPSSNPRPPAHGSRGPEDIF